MRSTEFLKEAPPNPEDSGGPARGTVGAAQADAARIAQGQKNLNSIKGFFGAKPEELKDAPPGSSIDPYVRARQGYKPATQQEIAAFQTANPTYGKVVDRDGNPIKSGTPGVTWDAGGEKATVQTAQAAAPMSKGDAHAGQQGYNTDLERVPGAAQTGQQGYNYQPPAAITPPARDRVDRTADIEADAERERIAQLAGVGRTPGAAQAGQQGYNYQPPAEPAPAPAPAPEVVQTATPDPAAAAKLPTRPGQQTSGPTAKAAPGVRPAIVGYASSMGLYKNGKPDPAAIKAFQQKNGLTADGIIGPDTSGAIISAAKPGDAGSGRGQQGVVAKPDAAGAGRGKQGGPAAPQPYEKTLPPMGRQQAATPSPAAPPRPGIGMAAQFEWDRQYGKTHNDNGTTKGTIVQTSTPATAAPPRPSIGMAAQFEWDRQYGKTHNANGTTKSTIAQAATAAPPQQRQGGPMRESSFDESVSRMRRLSTMLKG
jgi:hypothetical protein